MLRKIHPAAAAFAVLALIAAALVLLIAPARSAVTLPTCPSTVLTRSGTQTTSVNQANSNGTWDLSGAVWPSSFDQGTHTYPIRSDSWGKGCILGGEVHGPIGRNETRDQWYNATNGGDREGGEIWRTTMDSADDWVVNRDSYGSDFEDANDPNSTNAASTYYVDHQHLEWVRDDCVEDEDDSGVGVPLNVVINNSLWDGCFTVFAERPTYSNSGQQNGTGPQTLQVENSLIYSNPQPLGSTYCSDAKVTQGRCIATGTPGLWLGSHGIWKWSAAAASHVIMRNVTFRLDNASYSSCSPQQWPAGTYENVRLLWTNSKPYSSAGGCTNVLPAGVTLVSGQAALDEWNQKKAAWLAGNPTPSPTPTATTTAPTATPTATATATPTPGPDTDPTMIGAGDIADAGALASSQSTGDLIRERTPTFVFTVGDNAYPDGTASNYSGAYDPGWGSFKAKTYPAPGNHDYHTTNAQGYVDYFGASKVKNAQDGGTYYAYDVSPYWRAYSLNSEISMTGAQLTWLKADVAAHPGKHYIVYWHKPRYTSGSQHSGTTAVCPLWDAVPNLDLVLTGHNHVYERFAKMDCAGAVKSTGARQFVVGTGGNPELYTFNALATGEEYRNRDHMGVLKLQLHQNSYDWAWILSGRSATGAAEPTKGQVLDSGTAATNTVVGPGPTPSPTPTPTPSPTATGSPTPTPSPTATGTPTPPATVQTPTASDATAACGTVSIHYQTGAADTDPSDFDILVNGSVAFSDSLAPGQSGVYDRQFLEDEFNGQADIQVLGNGQPIFSETRSTNCQPDPTTGKSFVGGNEAQAGGPSLQVPYPSGVQNGDLVLFQIVHNKGTRSTLGTPAGLTAVGSQATDGGSLATVLYKCIVGSTCPATAPTFAGNSGETIYQMSGTSLAYRGVSNVELTATAVEGSTDAQHPVTGSTAHVGWDLVLGSDRITGTGVTGSNWTFGSTLSERRTNEQCTTDQTAGCISQSIADTAVDKPTGSHTYTAQTSNTVQYAITRLVVIY